MKSPAFLYSRPNSLAEAFSLVTPNFLRMKFSGGEVTAGHCIDEASDFKLHHAAIFALQP
jgi:hypothetical protein